MLILRQQISYTGDKERMPGNNTSKHLEVVGKGRPKGQKEDTSELACYIRWGTYLKSDQDKDLIRHELKAIALTVTSWSGKENQRTGSLEISRRKSPCNVSEER